MIARLRGTLVEKGADRCIVDVAGVGYEVTISLQSLAAIAPLGEETTLAVYTHVREDQIALFAFASEAERQVFQLLMTVSGIGPKLAIAVLSGMPLGELVRAISDANARRLTSISGVGKKLAERIALELKDKVGLVPGIGASSAPASSRPTTGAVGSWAPLAGQPAILGDVASVLANLGFRRERAEAAALALAGREEEGLDALVRSALRSLGGSP